MYPDPKKIKSERITMRLNGYDLAKLVHYSNTTGEQQSTIARKLFMVALDQELATLGYVCSMPTDIA